MLLMFFLPLLTLLLWFACSGHLNHSLKNHLQHGLARLRAVLPVLAIRLLLSVPQRSYRRMAEKGLAVEAGTIHRARSKPEWVKNEVLRLRALMPHTGCRKISDVFNRRFAVSRKMTVGKTYVSNMIRQHLYEVQVLRKHIKNAKPKSVPVNWVWGMDLTGKTDTASKLHTLLGIVEHGSRAVLCLQALRNKSSLTLLGHLFLAMGRYGKPRFVRTDNEAVFTSRVFRLALFLLGIRHQTTDLHCPWQNGRVERFFGTLKSSLDQLAVTSFDALNSALGEFRFFYNHVRPHQNLAGATPAESWAGVDPHRTKFKQEYWFEAWDGLLTGYYLRR